jgi:hypothetical protein
MKKQASKKRPRIKKPISKATGFNKESDNLPGYPHYPASEDVMNTEKKEAAIDIENPEHLLVNENRPVENSSPDLVEGTSADVTKEDIENLGDPNLAQDMGDDEDLKHRIHPVDMTAEDLIVPGSELDDAQEETGNEDEENNFYSHGDV